MADVTEVSVNEEVLTEITTTPPVEVTPLDQTLKAIRCDAHQNPYAYQDETEVPDGGE